MIVAPLIHTRTFSNDFEPRIKVVPKSFLDSDINWARKSILEATKSIDNLEGERWVIIDNDKYRVAGVVGFLKNIYQKCKNNNDIAETSELLQDDKGRLVYAFIGVVIDKNNSIEFSPLTYEYLWKQYVDILLPIWKRTYQEQIKSDYIDYRGSVNVNSITIPNKEQIGLKEIYESNFETDYCIFTKLLCDKKINNFSFCSNVSDISVVKDCSFSILTTSQNNITRLKRSISATPNSQSALITITDNQICAEENKDIEIKKKLFFRTSVLCLMILSIIIVIAILQVMGVI